MKPFSTPVLSKRTYRELKLLKHLRHENVCRDSASVQTIAYTEFFAGYQPQRHLYLSSRGHVCRYVCPDITLGLFGSHSYFVTELLGTDLHRLLTSRPLEKQFIQYFLYQILVCSTAPKSDRT